MAKRAVLMGRVSTDDQAENGYSLPSQLEACRKYAELQGFSVVGEFTDDISGVTPIAERPGGKQVQAMIDSKSTDAVIVYCVDRLARDTVELLVTARAWLRSGVELHFCDIGKVKSENDILLVIRGWVGGEERERIRERTKRGRDAKAQDGLVVSSAATPYGYTYNEGHITPNEQAEIVKMIYTWYVHGDDDGKKLSINGIAGKLTKMGVTTPGELKRQSWNRKRGPGVWNTATIHDILSNPTYCGQWQWGVTRSNNGIVDTSPKKDMTTVSVPAIIDRDLWQTVQERREYNRRMSKRNTKRKYLLRGLVQCCGYTMVGQYATSHSTKYYRCNNKQIKRFERKKPGCGRCIRCDVLDPIVWGYVLDIAANPETFRQLLLEAQQQELNALQPKRERLTMVEGLIAQAETDAAKFARALVDTSGGVVGDMLKKQIDDVNERYVALCAERDALTAEIEVGALTDEQIAATLAMFNKDVITGLRHATFEEKRRALEDLQVQVLIEGNNARVRCRIPIPDRVFAFIPL
jgi:site-specific DNA recombinase